VTRNRSLLIGVILALAAVAGSVAIIIAVLTAVGTEAKGVAFTRVKVAVA